MAELRPVRHQSGLHARGEGSASWLSSHGRGLGPRDALKKDSRGLSRVAQAACFVPQLGQRGPAR